MNISPRTKKFLAIGVLSLALVALIGALILYTPGNAEEMYQTAKAKADEMRTDEKAFADMLAQAKKDLEATEWDEFDLIAVEGEYYDFSAHATEGGGIRILAYKNAKGSFEVIYRGQDYPDCLDIERSDYVYRSYFVPVSLESKCLETNVTVKDRTTLFAELFTDTGKGKEFTSAYSLPYIEVVDTPSDREKGLSGWLEITDDFGMLFVFAEPTIPSFWMKDMHFAIDIIWLSDAGTIIGIEHEVTPETYPTTFHPPEPVRYVLEVRGGLSKEKGWEVGTALDLPLR